MRTLMAVVGVVIAVAVLSVVSLAGAASSDGRQGSVAVGGVHDVTQVGHHWTTLKQQR